MGKKKPALKRVERGVATTSVPSKKVEKDTPEDSDQIVEEKVSELNVQEGGLPSKTSPLADSRDKIETNPQSEAWEVAESSEQVGLQAVVDRLQAKANRDVEQIIKAIEFDSRLARSFQKLEANSDIRDRILDFALEEENGSNYRKNSRPEAIGDRELSTAYSSFRVLRYLGISESRAWECISKVSPLGNWEDCLDWVWLHCTEDECLGRGEFAQTAPSLEERLDTPLVPEVVSTEELKQSQQSVATESTSQIKSSISTPSREPTSLFRSAEESSDEEVDLDPAAINRKWAMKRIELDDAKSQQKFKSESAAVKEIKSELQSLEGEYLFNRKEAETIYRTMRDQMRADKIRDRLKGPADNSPVRSRSKPTKDESHALKPTSPSIQNDEEDLFGNMLDIPPDPIDGDGPQANTTITIRSMPLPGLPDFAATSPKSMLRDAMKQISGGSRAVRAGIEVRFSTNHLRVWRMNDIACENRLEAENFIALIALHELYASGQLDQPNWRVMPPAYRDLWDELEIPHQIKQKSKDRELWKKIRSTLEAIPVASQEQQGPKIDGDNTVAAKVTPKSMPLARSVHESVKADFEARVQSSKYQDMLTQRNTLPIAAYREEILRTIDSSRVSILSGDTGCGKSTQLPSFILERELAAGRECKIIVTEPRRISAISLANRVSIELGDAPGAVESGNSIVGYSIRLESKISAKTRLAFVTNGIALRMLENSQAGGGPMAFDDVTHIVVDEVHERSIESDFLLIALQTLVHTRKDLKIILMSATLDAEKLSNYFGGCPYLSVPGRTFPVQVNFLEDAVELCGWRIDENSQYAIRHRNFKTGTKQLEWTEDGARSDGDDQPDDQEDPTKLSSSKYSPGTVHTVNLLDSRQIPYDLIVLLLEQICFGSPDLSPYSAAILVFLPGIAEIRRLNEMIGAHPSFNMADFVIYPLHSTISSEGQSAVFDIPPPGVRKIVLSTNIAETGVTIPDITCVIDSGKHREMRFDEKRQLSRLIETYISRSNAKQRRGRAGRMAEHPVPEMLRLSLQDLALRIKILDFGLGNSIESVLLQALDPPTSINIQRAIAALVEVKALNNSEAITPLGRLLSKLPTDVHLGKFLLLACLYKCLDPALTIVAALNGKSPFITPFGHESAADAAKAAFSVGDSDFLTLANVFDSWRRVSSSQENIRVFCRGNYLSQQNLQQIEESRRQLLSYLVDSGFVDVTLTQRKDLDNARFGRGYRTQFVTVPEQLNENAGHKAIISSVLAAGLYPRILTRDGKASFKSINNQQIIFIHPTSVNRRLEASALRASHMVYYTIMKSKTLYAWETGPVSNLALAILCGDQADVRLAAGSLQIDRKVKYHTDSKSALAIKLVRRNLASSTAKRFRGVALTPAQRKWFEMGLEWLRSIEST
ncbi:P-loop containing nucleoside triphosphate hydrolase protein [Kockovaella imperatae]|uniref:RNA helicase n=1 Tax=Kockovaella imperatae TaxID=4999 RepID=A0A1Y1UCQ5_9TREE|nr:P-loop containing nucleoside triphosphate hydrolase protein [Kockovaella imperatae]ORX35792.1 P-loop containing nucleoside triphosphate hydrolase protein [Kockovaella imperatae]